jgi:hypothetical protein
MKVYWKPYQNAGFDGTIGMSPGILEKDESTLRSILAMPKKKPISFRMANEMFWDEIQNVLFEQEKPMETPYDLAQWISSQGYHIELSDSDYELVAEA